jgi:hypothetical protein
MTGVCYYQYIAMSTKYPVTYSVDYPNHSLNRLTTFFRIIVSIPILILLAILSSATMSHGGGSNSHTWAASGGLLFFAPLLMILFRQKYPRWWFDWNLEFLRFANRVGVYLLVMTDAYPSTDEGQGVHLNIAYPDAAKDLNRWLPLVKWFLAIPHYLVLIVLDIAALIVTVVAWLSILFTGQYPKAMFDFVEGTMRWNLRVVAYAFILATDEYPPFSIEP